jgi:hypothetical protein
MRSFTLSLLFFAVMPVALNAQAQSEPKQSTEPGSSISGRVTLGGKPAPGVKVIAVKRERRSQDEAVASAKTDQDGRFQLNKLPSDHYTILPLAPAYIASEQTEPERPGKAVPLADGETIEGLDFTLIRGSVITGRIADANGQPITQEMVTLIQIDPNGRKRALYPFTLLPQYDFGTDDQGIYRIFGLPPGRYLVSAGKGTEQDTDLGGGLRYHPRTFYPGVAEESEAGIVELSAGAVATGIDITLGHKLKAYSVSGRVIDVTTGRTIPNAQLALTTERISGDHRRTSGTSLRADANGNFRLAGLLPGDFHLMATPEAESGLYGSVAFVQIKDQDITGLEITVRRGSSISGVLTVEGANDPEVMARLSLLKLWGSVSSPDISDANNTAKISAVGPDGGFRISGLRPGKVSLHLSGTPDAKGFSVLRLERGGVECANGIDVGPSEHVTDIRVILGYANGRIRGQVKIEGGKLPLDAEISILLRRVDGPSGQSSPRVVVDPNGRFVVEHLITGEYRISVHVFRPPSSPDGGTSTQLAREVTKRVSVNSGAESEVLFVVELTAKGNQQ